MNIQQINNNTEINFASDNFAAEYDKEIQEIFKALRLADGCKVGKHGIWASDESYISDIDPSDYALDKVSKELQITIGRSVRFVEAAMELRNNRSKQQS